MDKQKIIIYTDGACSGNPGRGGWASILICKDLNGKVIHKKQICGSSEMATNNQMELKSVIEGLKQLKIDNCNVDIFSDSKYVIDGATKWLSGWVDNNWVSSSKKPVKNIEYWKELLDLMRKYNIQWNWVKGHSNDVLNNEVDLLARKMAGSN